MRTTLDSTLGGLTHVAMAISVAAVLALIAFIGLALQSGVARAEESEAAPSPDRDALLALYNATDGASWTNTWDTDQPIDEWHGVTTDDDGRVRVLRLSRNNLAGVLPAELGSLAALEQLVLTGNELTGPIPASLGGLTALKWLYLDKNQRLRRPRGGAARQRRPAGERGIRNGRGGRSDVLRAARTGGEADRRLASSSAEEPRRQRCGPDGRLSRRFSPRRADAGDQPGQPERRCQSLDGATGRSGRGSLPEEWRRHPRRHRRGRAASRNDGSVGRGFLAAAGQSWFRQTGGGGVPARYRRRSSLQQRARDRCCPADPAPAPLPRTAIGAPNDNQRPPPAPFIGIERGPSRPTALTLVPTPRPLRIDLTAPKRR